jgi:hypothetical protein
VYFSRKSPTFGHVNHPPLALSQVRIYHVRLRH